MHIPKEWVHKHTTVFNSLSLSLSLSLSCLVSSDIQVLVFLYIPFILKNNQVPYIFIFFNNCNCNWAESQFQKGMAFNGFLYLLYLGVLTLNIISSVLIMAAAVTPTTLVDRTSLNRSSFPKGFIFGTSSSSYQVSFVALCVLLCNWRVETDFLQHI
jgi:hypothetical protein